jgi:muramoyltetrapeptide carboxypeptidase LdcA involved in peptidoglycan recycling
MTENFILPPALEKGDKVAIVGVGNGATKKSMPEAYENALDKLRDRFDLEPVEFPMTQKSPEYLTEHPEERAEEVMEAFRRDDIKGVIAVTGGSGEQIRILKHLDSEVLRNNPTRFYGLSDNTSLHLYLWNQGIISFYGPALLNNIGSKPLLEYTRKYSEKAFFEDKIGKIEASEQFTDQTLDWKDPDNHDKQREMEENPGWEWHNANGEIIEGRTFGGCFEVLCIQAQTSKYLPEPEEVEGKILVLETSEELPESFWVDWFMMSLGERGLLQKFKAILVGRPKTRHFEELSKEEREKYRKEQKEAIKKNIQRYSPETPIVFDMDFGHTNPIAPLAMGGTVQIDTENKEIELR